MPDGPTYVRKKTMPKKVRHKVLRVNLDFLFDFIKEGEHHFKSSGIPQDSKYIRFGHDHMGSLFLIVEHESFPEIGNGDKYPELDVVFEKL